ncbi:hypothetical protein [Bacillus sp. S10(2024)]|uniref:hypothetical protein n=1 Tax=Bacillus sp. S10(2024) TaxID=3162886 RepID=UPI003D1DD6E6
MYTYDATSNRTTIERKNGDKTEKTTYAYDSINQLTKETLPKGKTLSRVQSKENARQFQKASIRLAGKVRRKTLLGPIGWAQDAYVFSKGFRKGWKSYKKR